MNTKPSTLFGHFFHRIGIWHPKFEETIEDIYGKLQTGEQEAIKQASGIIAIVNANLQLVPEQVWDIIQTKFPDVTEEHVTELINKLNATIAAVDDYISEDYGTALIKLQAYLAQYVNTHNVWAAITRSVVEILADIKLNGKLNIQTITTVLEFVYQTFIKGKVA